MVEAIRELPHCGSCVVGPSGSHAVGCSGRSMVGCDGRCMVNEPQWWNTVGSAQPGQDPSCTSGTPENADLVQVRHSSVHPPKPPTSTTPGPGDAPCLSNRSSLCSAPLLKDNSSMIPGQRREHPPASQPYPASSLLRSSSPQPRGCSPSQRAALGCYGLFLWQL